MVNEYLKRTRKTIEIGDYKYEDIRPRMKCADGFEVSVQASCNHYCEPREDGAEHYDEVELGYPNMEEPLINDYAEEDDYTNTVYGWVPVDIVNQVIEKHGGIIN